MNSLTKVFRQDLVLPSGQELGANGVNLDSVNDS